MEMHLELELKNAMMVMIYLMMDALTVRLNAKKLAKFVQMDSAKNAYLVGF